MTAVSAFKQGVTDTAAGAGVLEWLGLQGPLAALSQLCSVVPHGDAWQIKGSLSFTPTLITDVLPPSPVLAWKVPVGKALLFTGGVYHCLAAATDYARVCRRYFLFGYQATVAPAAPAAPSVAVQAGTDGIGITGTFQYKVAPIDSFRRESAISTSSAVAITAINRCVTVTPAALGTGVIGYNIYRTLAGGSTFFYVGTTLGATPYIDAQPDANIDTSLTPNATWSAAGAVVGETMDGPGEMIVEVGAVALTGAPTKLVYTGAYGAAKQMIAGTFPTTVGQRIRYKPYGETSNFIAVGTATNNAWRGAYGSDLRDRHEEDLGVTAVSGVDTAPSAGSFMVFGQQVIGSTGRQEATAAIKALNIVPTNPHGVLIPPLGEIVVEIGALAAGVAGVRDVSLHGLMLPTTGT